MNQQAEELQQDLLKLLAACGRITLEQLAWDSSRKMLQAMYPLHATFLTGDLHEQVQPALWELIRRGLVWISMGMRTNDATPTLNFVLTERGRALLRDEAPNPDDPSGYMRRLTSASPKTSAGVQQYLLEALRCYREDCCLASMVMLGVASESTTLDTIALFVGWLQNQGTTPSATLTKKGETYVHKLAEFQKRLMDVKQLLPGQLRDTVSIDITGLLEIIRLTRNDAGHPTGVRFERDDCHSKLAFYAGAHKKLHILMEFFRP